jgi:hypothetical protein
MKSVLYGLEMYLDEQSAQIEEPAAFSMENMIEKYSDLLLQKFEEKLNRK